MRQASKSSLCKLSNTLSRENLLGDGMLNRDGELWKTVSV